MEFAWTPWRGYGLVITVVSIFLGYKLYEAQVKMPSESAPIGEQFSLVAFSQDKKLSLNIKGIKKSEPRPSRICILSVTKNGKSYYLNGEEVKNQNLCDQPNSANTTEYQSILIIQQDCEQENSGTITKQKSIVIPKEDGSWEFKGKFCDKEPITRTIRVREIYNNKSYSKPYIDKDFTIGVN